LVDTTAIGTIVTRSYYHLDTSGFLSFNGGSQFVPSYAPFRNWTTPRAFGWCAVQWVGRKKPFHTFDVPGRCTVTLIHVTATDPFCAGRHSDLVGTAIIPNRRANGMSSMEKIIARLRRIIPARIAYAVVNRVVPV
jgi:hypothetical protein